MKRDWDRTGRDFPYNDQFFDRNDPYNSRNPYFRDERFDDFTGARKPPPGYIRDLEYPPFYEAMDAGASSYGRRGRRSNSPFHGAFADQPPPPPPPMTAYDRPPYDYPPKRPPSPYRDGLSGYSRFRGAPEFGEYPPYPYVGDVAPLPPAPPPPGAFYFSGDPLEPSRPYPMGGGSSGPPDYGFAYYRDNPRRGPPSMGYNSGFHQPPQLNFPHPGPGAAAGASRFGAVKNGTGLKFGSTFKARPYSFGSKRQRNVQKKVEAKVNTSATAASGAEERKEVEEEDLTFKITDESIKKSLELKFSMLDYQMNLALLSFNFQADLGSIQKKTSEAIEALKKAPLPSDKNDSERRLEPTSEKEGVKDGLKIEKAESSDALVKNDQVELKQESSKEDSTTNHNTATAASEKIKTEKTTETTTKTTPVVVGPPLPPSFEKDKTDPTAAGKTPSKKISKEDFMMSPTKGKSPRNSVDRGDGKDGNKPSNGGASEEWKGGKVNTGEVEDHLSTDGGRSVNEKKRKISNTLNNNNNSSNNTNTQPTKRSNSSSSTNNHQNSNTNTKKPTNKNLSPSRGHKHTHGPSFASTGGSSGGYNRPYPNSRPLDRPPYPHHPPSRPLVEDRRFYDMNCAPPPPPYYDAPLDRGYVEDQFYGPGPGFYPPHPYEGGGYGRYDEYMGRPPPPPPPPPPGYHQGMDRDFGRKNKKNKNGRPPPPNGPRPPFGR